MSVCIENLHPKTSKNLKSWLPFHQHLNNPLCYKYNILCIIWREIHQKSKKSKNFLWLSFCTWKHGSSYVLGTKSRHGNFLVSRAFSCTCNLFWPTFDIKMTLLTFVCQSRGILNKGKDKIAWKSLGDQREDRLVKRNNLIHYNK